MGYHSALRPFPDFETGVQPDGSIIDLNGTRYERADLDTLLRKRQELPCAQRADDIAHIVKHSAICVIRAGVGAGKSTQIAQIVYDRILGRKGVIFNTQPRVLNAMELAKRVALEWIAGTKDVAHSFGHGVGTSTGDYKNFSRDSHTVFMTDGVFLRRFDEAGMPDVLMVDEAHLYTPATEHLLLMLQRHYRQEKRELKLVIMSATLDPERLRELFSPVTKNLPILDIEGASGVFHREYLGDIPVTDCAADVAKRGLNALVFVEGRAAIRKGMEELAGRMPHCRIHAMHSSVSPEERERIMALPRDPARPIVIFATNMAEDGLTFPWADVVIDSAKERVMTVDDNGIPLLRTQAVSRANNTQRNGRGIGRMV